MEGHLSGVASDALQGHEAMLVALVEGGWWTNAFAWWWKLSFFFGGGISSSVISRVFKDDDNDDDDDEDDEDDDISSLDTFPPISRGHGKIVEGMKFRSRPPTNLTIWPNPPDRGFIKESIALHPLNACELMRQTSPAAIRWRVAGTHFQSLGVGSVLFRKSKP